MCVWQNSRIPTYFSIRGVCLENNTNLFLQKVHQQKAIKYTSYIFNCNVNPFLEFQEIVCVWEELCSSKQKQIWASAIYNTLLFLNKKVCSSKSLKLTFVKNPSTSNRNQNLWSCSKSATPRLPDATGDETLEALHFSISKPWAGVAWLLRMGKAASGSPGHVDICLGLEVYWDVWRRYFSSSYCA